MIEGSRNCISLEVQVIAHSESVSKIERKMFHEALASCRKISKRRDIKTIQGSRKRKRCKHEVAMTVEGILHETFASDPPATESFILMDGAPTPMEVATVSDVVGGTETRVDEVWREIVSGEGKGMKEEEETQHGEMMMLEDFLAKATGGEDGNGGGESDEVDVKILPTDSIITIRFR
ncbi:Basic-leucine zipper (bZIP) transcription factor family protein [Raphanus sativus]|nr:Basic-leucine zipper (bZIP) transcription factor family protein [Raphanus sativus]